MRVFVINGTGGSGKDTFVEFFRSFYPKTVNISTIDPVKAIARMCGWDGSKTEKNRKFLSDLKDLLTEWNDVPFKDVKTKVESFGESEGYVFIHCREPKEIDKLKNEFNAKTILIKRFKENITSNHADAEVDNYDYDYVVNNTGTLNDLKIAVKNFIKTIK